jgi:uncharacterized protein
MAQTHAEPSMEEILSSIKRIIAEDSEAALSGPRVKRAVGLTPLAAPEAPDDEEVLELTDPVAQDAAEPEVAPVAASKPEKKPVLVSPATEEASRSSLAALSALIVKPEVTGSDTLEGLVRDMLKPMLAEWLDTNLPAIVEQQVAQEIARITARG